MAHIPVLLNEVINILDVGKGEKVIDGTVNGGGHGEKLLEAIGPQGIFIGIDADEAILTETKKRLHARNAHFIHGNYRDIPHIIQKLGIEKVDTILLDLGFSSHQIDDPKRGLSFRYDGPLDMRYDTAQGQPAYALLNAMPEKDLADLIYAYGEERQARRIAKAISAFRRKEKITRTDQLREIIEKSIPRRGKIHPATKTFQALRIYVNGELANLERFLNELPDILTPKGRCAIITFHSLEDRMVKHAFREFKIKKIADVLTKKPIRPTREEIVENPRARSAKLRVLIKK